MSRPGHDFWLSQVTKTKLPIFSLSSMKLDLHSTFSYEQSLAPESTIIPDGSCFVRQDLTTRRPEETTIEQPCPAKLPNVVISSARRKSP